MIKAAILTIGDELLNGQTIDTNSAWISQELGSFGIQITCKMSVSDQEKAIRHGLDTLYVDANIVIVTGGLGPTKRSLANYFGDELIFSEKTYDRLAAYFSKRGRTPLEAHRQQCMLPKSAELISNDRGTAPGMWIAHDERYLLSMPGVPSEMKGIMHNGGLERISALNTDTHIDYQILRTIGIGESMVAERIRPILQKMPDHIQIAYLPGIASVKLRLTAVGQNKELLETSNALVAEQIKEELGDYVYGEGDLTIQEVIGQLARERDCMIGTAESCTGGHISQLITSISGSSSYYKGSVIAYANEVKTNILGVSLDDLEQHGAVSEPVVQQMVKGLIDHIGVDLAVAVSGIAGPNGGTPTKPVGTIWIAVGDKTRTETKKLSISKNRELNIQYTAVYALDLLRRFLQKNK